MDPDGPSSATSPSTTTFGRPGRRRAARVIVLDPRDRLLLINAKDPARRSGAGWWEVPGGGMDPGETSEETVRRELWEEAGIRDAEVGPCVWVQSVEFTFAGWRFEQDEWVHVARCDGTSAGPMGLEAFEAMAFGEQRWWSLDQALELRPRTIPYRMLEFLPDVVAGKVGDEPIDITPGEHHVAQWHAEG